MLKCHGLPLAHPKPKNWNTCVTFRGPEGVNGRVGWGPSEELCQSQIRKVHLILLLFISAAAFGSTVTTLLHVPGQAEDTHMEQIHTRCHIYTGYTLSSFFLVFRCFTCKVVVGGWGRVCVTAGQEQDSIAWLKWQRMNENPLQTYFYSCQICSYFWQCSVGQMFNDLSSEP